MDELKFPKPQIQVPVGDHGIPLVVFRAESKTTTKIFLLLEDYPYDAAKKAAPEPYVGFFFIQEMDLEDVEDEACRGDCDYCNGDPE